MNVKFKQGLSTNLPIIENGSILYTTDTNELYIDANDTRNKIAGGGNKDMTAKLVGIGEFSDLTFTTTSQTFVGIVSFTLTFTLKYKATSYKYLYSGKYENNEWTYTGANLLKIPVNCDYIVFKTNYITKYATLSSAEAYEYVLPKNSSSLLGKSDFFYITFTEDNCFKLDVLDSSLENGISSIQKGNGDNFYLEFYRYE